MLISKNTAFVNATEHVVGKGLLLTRYQLKQQVLKHARFRNRPICP